MRGGSIVTDVLKNKDQIIGSLRGLKDYYTLLATIHNSPTVNVQLNQITIFLTTIQTFGTEGLLANVAVHC